MGDPADDELADRVSALEGTLEELREELEPQRGPLGLPRPPTPRDVFRFTDEYAIPAAIAILEANVRTLELLQAIIRGARGAPREDEIRGRATSLGRTTVERVDRALADLGSVIEDADLPRNAEARTLLEEARSLNDEVRNSFASTDRTGRIGVDADPSVPEAGDADTDDHDEETPDDARPGIEIDVDAELESIKDELDEDGTVSDEASGAPDGSDETHDGSGEARAGDET